MKLNFFSICKRKAKKPPLPCDLSVPELPHVSIPGTERSWHTSRKHNFDFLSDTAMPACEIQPPLGELTDPPTPLASPPGDKERELYYAGLPSCPWLLARSSTFLWKAPEAFGRHIRIERSLEMWTHSIVGLMDKVGPDIIETLHSKSVPWTSVNVLRIGYEGMHLPVILWIGVKPLSLSRDDVKIALECKGILVKYSIYDADCELQEAETFPLTKLMKPSLYDQTADLQVYLTGTLGILISTKVYPDTKGTLGLYLNSQGKTYGVTARHVVFPSKSNYHARFNYNSADESQEWHEVVLPGGRTLNRLGEDVKMQHEDYEVAVDLKTRKLTYLSEKKQDGMEEVQETKNQLEEIKWGILHLEALDKNLQTFQKDHNHVMGHIAPISTGNPDNYMANWCVYEVSSSKINDFSGNVVDLGRRICPKWFTRAMNPNIKNAHKFVYPIDRQVLLWDIIPIAEMNKPLMIDKKGSLRLMVFKRGSVTGMGNEIMSYTRTCGLTTKAWPILGCEKFNSVPFSKRGDFGAVVADARCRMGGLLTGGSGNGIWSEVTNVTYITPLEFLLKNMEENGVHNPDVNVGPQEPEEKED